MLGVRGRNAPGQTDLEPDLAVLLVHRDIEGDARERVDHHLVHAHVADRAIQLDRQSAGMRVARSRASGVKATFGVNELPTVRASPAAWASLRPGDWIVMVPGAETPEATTYWLVSPASVITSPGLTVPVPVARTSALVPIG
jgi:hypothetical protein